MVRANAIVTGDCSLRARVTSDGINVFAAQPGFAVSLPECVPLFQQGIKVVEYPVTEEQMVGPHAAAIVAMVQDALVTDRTDEQGVGNTVRGHVLVNEPERAVSAEAVVSEFPATGRLLGDEFHESFFDRPVARTFMRGQCSTSARHVIVVTTQAPRICGLTTKGAGRHSASLPEVTGGCKDQ